ncbi:hypothetical protein IV498_08570 [Paenarthrobacter sp. Z7-10]|uniref:hypothetical protein n=1 Tax=Paenarthrobacter sp. Z7-10 TaxID=2787635 RepID=UPI0022A9C107|nr:hypothetical protein [Paenarthrobacter sp. Z7-10]MCZ2403234.1 hypothetical protein [Paenarthrobacter sp. Z7-10]
MDAMVERFRNLCRSSPWKWQSLRFELSWQHPDKLSASTPEHLFNRLPAAMPDPRPEHRFSTDRPGAAPGETDNEPGSDAPDAGPGALHCWLRRPQALRVETVSGVLLHSTTGINDSKDALFTSGTRKPWLLPAYLVTPVYDDDGLVRRRPEAAYGEPAYGDARFAAVLDPVELAGNAPVPLDFPFANVAEVGPVTVVDEGGRTSLESILTANVSYHPALAAAPLLYPGRTAIRIDAGTGVCVASRSLDGSTAGAGHILEILAVDEYMLDDLFLEVSMGLTDVRKHISWDIGPAA